jgi:hypothetical protein
MVIGNSFRQNDCSGWITPELSRAAKRFGLNELLGGAAGERCYRSPRALEVDLAETSYALILARRIKDRLVKRQRFTYPFRKSCMIRKIVISERMDEGG